MWFRSEEQGFGDAPRAAIKAALLGASATEEADPVGRILATTVGEVGMMELEEGRWPELMPAVFAWLTSAGSTPTTRLAALRVLENLTIFVASFMRKDFPTLARIFGAALGSSSDPSAVRLQAARALCSLVAWEDAGSPSLEPFAPLASALVHFTGAAVAAGQTSVAEEALALLCDVGARQPGFFKPVLTDAITGMLTIADSAAVAPKPRRLALEFVVVLGEASPGLVRKIPDNRFVKQILPVLLQAMVRVDPAADPGWEAREVVEETDPETPADTAAMHVERVVLSVGPSRTLPVLYPMLAAASVHADWPYRLAAMQGLGAAAAGHPPTTNTEDLRGMAVRICKCASDAEPRVRVAAASAISSWCSHHGPSFQTRAADVVLPAVGALLNDPHPRVQCAAVEALNEFVGLSFPGTVDTHAPRIVDQLLRLLGSGTRTVREYCLLCIGSLGKAASHGLVEVYPTLGPFLRTLAEDPMPAFAAAARGAPLPAIEPRRVRGLACEALTSVASAVGRDVCGRDIPAILATLGRAAAEAKGPADTLRASAWESLAAMAQNFPEDAAAVVPVLVPALIASASASLDSRAVTAEQADAFRRHEEEEAAMGGSTEPEFALFDDSASAHGVLVRVASMEDRAMAFHLLTRLTHSSASSGALAPYLASAVPVVGKALADARLPCAQARNNAAELASDLVLSAAVAAARAGCTPEAIVATARPVVTSFLTVLLPAVLEPGLDADTRVALAGAIKFCIMEGGLERATDGRAAACAAQGETSEPGAWAPSHLSAPSGHLHHAHTFRPFLPAEILARVVATAVQAVRESRKRVATSRADVTTRPDEFDEEARDDVEMAVATEEDAQSQLIDLIATVARTHHAAGLAAIEAHSGAFLRDDLLAPGASATSRRLAVFVMDDILEFAGPEGVRRLPAYIPTLLEAVAAASDSIELAQAGAYGLGAAAQAAGPAFAPHAPAALTALWGLARAIRPDPAPHAAAASSLAEMGVPGIAASSGPVGLSDRLPNGVQALVDNALTAAAKVLHFTVAPLGGPAAPADVTASLAEWAARLPICADGIEARTATAILCERLAAGCPSVVGGSPAATARALTSVAWALRTDAVAAPFVFRAAAAACAALNTRLGPAGFAAVWALVPEAVRPALEGAAAQAEQLAPALPAPAAPVRAEALPIG